MKTLLLVLLAQNVTVNNALYRGADGGWVNRVQPSSTVEVTPTAYGMSAFGNVRTAEPYTLFDGIHTYGLDTDDWSSSTSGTGSAVTAFPSESAVLLTSAGDGGLAGIRTDANWRYQAGKGARVLTTAVLHGAVDAGQVYRLGLFDDANGLGWRYDGAGLRLFVRSSVDGGVTETLHAVTTPAGWDVTKGNIYELTFQWLGVGTVAGYLNGTRAVTVAHAGTLPFVYTGTAMLPVTYEARGGVVPAAGASMKSICSSVQSEGGSEPPSHTFSARRTVNLSVAGTTSDVPVISLRPAATFGGQANRAQLHPTRVWCSADTQRVRVDVVLDPATLVGASFASAGSTSAAEVSVAATTSTGGTLVTSFGVSANTSEVVGLEHIFASNRRHLGRQAYSTPSGTGLDSALDTLTVRASNPAANPATVVCGIDWQEVR